MAAQCSTTSQSVVACPTASSVPSARQRRLHSSSRQISCAPPGQDGNLLRATIEFQSSQRWRQQRLHASRRESSVQASTSGNGASSSEPEVANLVIIGSGPAGYTAAIYAARANLRPIVFEGFQKGGVRGGQLMTTTEVENFPGFPDGISGPDLMDRMRQQAERWGAVLITEDVDHVDVSQRPFVVRGTDTEYKASSIIVATGATAKRLGIPSETKFWSNGISACAICDGASPIFKNQELAVVGGGDTAAEEAIYLTKYGKHVHLLVRSSKLRASKAMQDRVFNDSKITVHLNASVGDAYADNKGMAGLTLVNPQSGEERKLPVRGLFYGIGHQPNTDLLKGQIELDEMGYIKVRDQIKTNVEGVFAAGDVFDTEWRQAITAAGTGCSAALAAERYLAANDLIKEYHQEVKAPAQPASAAPVADASTKEFDINHDRFSGGFALRKLYHESNRVILVLYTSPTCGPCRTLKPMVNKIIDEYTSKVHFVEINIEQDPEIAQAAGVNGTPTVQIFKDKERLSNLPGVKMKREYKQIIEANL